MEKFKHPVLATLSKPIILGVSGTQVGATHIQKRMLHRVLLALGKVSHFHHGDCVGVDELMHSMVLAHWDDVEVNIHPPINRTKRAFCRPGKTWPAKDYLVRNKDIVDASTLMIFAPKECEEQLRSGTWSTYRYAKKRNVPYYLVLPDGEVVFSVQENRPCLNLKLL